MAAQCLWQSHRGQDPELVHRTVYASPSRHRHRGLHAALGNESPLRMELGDRDKTAISGQLSIINVTKSQ